MSDVTTHLGLPLLAAGQAQKHVTHNEALALLDGLVQLACLDKDLGAPPASPAEGDRYLVTTSSPTGAWRGLSGQVVRFTDGVWVGAVPAAGWIAYIADEKRAYVFDGQAWSPLTSSGASDRLGINTQADATNRLALKSDAALFSWDDVTPGSGDARFTINKKLASRDAGFVFQTGWSSRALFGTLGGDDFVLKTSSDGSAFVTALTAVAATGIVSFAKSPVAPTPASTDSSTQLATTAYVQRALAPSRVAISDADYTVQATDRIIAITKLTASRTLTLPSASTFPLGTNLTFLDETGACSPSQTLSLHPASSETINGMPGLALDTPYAFLSLQSDGVSRWTVAGRKPTANRSTFTSVAYPGPKQVLDNGFHRIAMPNILSDDGQNWDSTNNWYVCPRTGIYQIDANLRLVDRTASGTQYGLGVYTDEADGPWFLWHFTGTGSAIRSTFAYSRMTVQNAGDRLRLYSYTEPTASADSAALQICLISEAV